MSSPSSDCTRESSITSLKPAKRLSLLTQHSPLAMIEWDRDLTVVGWNSAAAELFNFFEDEALGQRLDELLAQRQIADLGRESWQSAEPAGSLHSHMSIAGQKLCRWYNTPFIVKGQLVGTLSTVIDVSHQTALSNEELRTQLRSRTQVLKHTTERLQSVMSDRSETTTALLESEARFRTLAANVPGVLYQFCMHADGRYSFPYIAAACHGLFDLSPAELQSDPKQLMALLSEADQIALKTTMHESAKALSSWHGEYQITTLTQQSKWVQVSAQPQLTSEGDILWSGMLTDITERKSFEHQLQSAHHFLHVPGMLYQFRLSADLKPSFPFVSASCQELFGLSTNQVQTNASSLIDLIHPSDRQPFDQSVAQSAKTLTDWQWIGRFVLSSGQTRWIQGQARPEKLPDDSILWDGLLMDITDSKASEEALHKTETKLRAQTKQLKATLKKLKQTQSNLIQSEKMSSLGQLVAGIAHEINNPVNFIHGNLAHAEGYITDLLKMIRLYQAHYPMPVSDIQKLNDELELDYIVNDLPKLLTSVKAGSDRIRQIVLSLRNFSRLDESELKQADIHDGLESSLMILANRLKPTASRHAIEVVKAYENIPMVECYVSQLNQVFMSILVNAIDAIDRANVPDKIYQIVLQTFQNKGSIVIRITNNGPPIPKEAARRIFDPFFTTKPVGKGTGMGLAISYQTIVELHEGTLHYSQTEDQKTVFSIEIPTKLSTNASVISSQ